MFGYIRVSTAKQGKGVSLEEQKRSIESYASRNNLVISRWFEEKETAAKSGGRPMFKEMLRLLRTGKAKGVIIHKIDRSARNLRDWADIGELIDSGIEIHFSHEALDLAARGGRLSADIQAVIAADYIRNLREEAKKGIYGRLRQGFYPLAAPVGYLDKGAGRAKEIDPKMGPLIKRLFQLYTTRRYGYRELSEMMYKQGLRNRRGGKVSRSGVGYILNNPFYIGLMRIKASGQVFEGNHEPLIKKSLFDDVQKIIAGKSADSKVQHNYLFRKRIRCGYCGRLLTGELQKGHVYYRCHGSDCPLRCVREDLIDKVLKGTFNAIQLTDEEFAEMKGGALDHDESTLEAEKATLELRLKQVEARLESLSDKFIDDLIDESTYSNKRNKLLNESVDIKEQLSQLTDGKSKELEILKGGFELLRSIEKTYLSGNIEKKQRLLDYVTSNHWTISDSLEISLNPPFFEVAGKKGVLSGGPQRDNFRTRLSRRNRKTTRERDQLQVVFTKSRGKKGEEKD